MTDTSRSYRICPSIIAGDFMSMGESIDELARAGCEHIHLDIMDGQFVPQITFGEKMVRDVCRRYTEFVDCHLMVSDPASQAVVCADAGADLVIVHLENFKEWGGARGSLETMLIQLSDLGVQTGVAIDGPTADLKALEPFLPGLDMVLVATGKVGKAGQGMDLDCLNKVKVIRACKAGKDIDIMVDIGVNPATLKAAVDSGANWFAASSAVFGHPSGAGAGFTLMNDLLKSYI